MSMTEFAMIEELAFLVEDNLPCKHLVLSMEESFVNFLQDNPSSDGVLELEPMNAYNRLLLHRLADIFGLSHQSVVEGDDRHLILERCLETLIPSVLVSDLLWQYDELQLPTTSHRLLKRNEASPGMDVGYRYVYKHRFHPRTPGHCKIFLLFNIFLSFSKIEELAFLVEDNLPCKHLVLSMEESFVNFLQDNPSSDGVLELEPMNAYNRLLLHRLADIFGLSHQSVVEGDDRHLILERRLET
ncbi:uncharacterized protein LOC130752854 isoform X3 [Actinidia eriantha]|uniref:uncharacterized protein LOC130752854 isoform X3 n=1 Tax=Actinidia eriantha TaxID=165200 RepID=UPI002588A537|nr:uncharacterized protein LOC130752854 isoform X3 [Actinidia eriantha]XP_057462704.1 uncharacterized protein LOC130752854 isoform X3 [Actinidia eriantha]